MNRDSEPIEHKAKVLTIDDDQLVRRAFASVLSRSGYEMLEAEDGKSGIETIRRAQPDVVLLDLRMPGMDGLDVLSELRRKDTETPVIVVSGADAIGDAIEALKRGAWDYLTKPITDIALLETAVARGVERARLMRENREYREQIEGALQQLRRDQEAGRAIQFQLLPPKERDFGGYRFSQRLFPSAILSGDFVDYFSIDARRVGFYIADVAGHGAASAFVTVMVKTLMRQYRDAFTNDDDQTIVDAAKTLARLHVDILKQRVDKHLTMFYGVLDVEAHKLSYSSAAQFPYPVVRTTGEVSLIERPSRPIALFPDADYRRYEISTAEDFSLLLVSDGLLELLPDNNGARKTDALTSPLARGVERLDDLIDEFGIDDDTVLTDDVALLLVRRIQNA